MARPDWIVNQPLLSAVAWTKFQGRTNALAAALGGQARFFGDGFTGHRLAARPLAYVMKSFQTWNTLSRDNPRTVLVITPPVFAPLVAWLNTCAGFHVCGSHGSGRKGHGPRDQGINEDGPGEIGETHAGI